MIGAPINDRACLDKVTSVIAEMVDARDPALVGLVARFSSPEALAAWMRTLPQRDDEGDRDDGPKLACRPPQRLRIPAQDPNCFERSAMYLGGAELLDPAPHRQLVTVTLPIGRHTFPVEDGEPVVLDSGMTKSDLKAAMFQLWSGPIEITPSGAADWVAEIAEEPAARRGTVHRVRNARHAMHRVIAGQPLSPRSLADMAYTVALAGREARRFGMRGVALHRETATGLATSLASQHLGHRNAFELRLGGLRLRPDLSLLGALAKVGGRLGAQVGLAALQSQLGKLGVTGPVIGQVERELNKEGMSLGAFARAPMPGSLAALGRDALLSAALRRNAGPRRSAQLERNASWWAVKTPGVIWDEMKTTQSDIHALGKDIYATFRRPFETQLAIATTRFTAKHGRAPGQGKADSNVDPAADMAEIYGWMNPKPTARDIGANSYEGGFVDAWSAFEQEWDDFTGTHNAWYKRMWKGDYDKTIEFRERAVKWREEFQKLGGKPTTPVPIIPEDGPVPWRSILMVAGIGAAALIVPEVLRTVRGGSARAAAA